MAASHRLVWLAVAVALLYTLTWSWPETLALILLKGTAVALLALYCAITERGPERWPLTAVFVFGALGDMLLQWQMIVGAASFTVGHLVAIRLYRRHRDETVTAGAQRNAWLIAALAIAISAALMFVPIFSNPPMPGEVLAKVGLALAAIVYIMVVAGMAVSLWLSQFRRSGAAALGALYFVVSDVLIIGRMGPLVHAPLINEVIWGLYVGAQVLICTGVIAGLRTMRAYRDSQLATAAIGSAP